MRKPISIILVVVLIILSLTITVAAAAQYESLQKGSKGEAVIKLQNTLNKLGYSVGKADGDYGAKTMKAVKKFQSDNGLDATGIADSKTQEKLYSLAESNTDEQNTSGGSVIDSKLQAAVAFTKNKTNNTSPFDVSYLITNIYSSIGLGDAGLSMWKSAKDLPKVDDFKFTDSTMPYGWTFVMNERGMVFSFYKAGGYYSYVHAGGDNVGSISKNGFISIYKAILNSCENGNMKETYTFVDLKTENVFCCVAGGGSADGLKVYSSVDEFFSAM